MSTINWIQTHIDYCFSWTLNSLSGSDFIEESLNNCLAGPRPPRPHRGCKCLSAGLMAYLWGAGLFTRAVRTGKAIPTLFTHLPRLGDTEVHSNPSRALAGSVGTAWFPFLVKILSLWAPCEQGHHSDRSMATLFIQGLHCFQQAELSRSRQWSFRMSLGPVLLTLQCAHESPEDLVKTQTLVQGDWAGAWDSACLMPICGHEAFDVT